jgi:hypothetical protein
MAEVKKTTIKITISLLAYAVGRDSRRISLCATSRRQRLVGHAARAWRRIEQQGRDRPTRPTNPAQMHTLGWCLVSAIGL